MRLGVIIPAYNEEETIGQVLNRVLSINLEPLGIEKEIIVVDDGSTDKTSSIVRQGFTQVLLLKNVSRQGKGSAIKKALDYSAADIFLIQDADLEYSPEAYPQLLEPIIDGKAKVVYGSRFLSTRYPTEMLFLNYLGNRIGTFLVNLLYQTGITDLMTGYKVFLREAIKDISLRHRGFDFCAEITAKFSKKGINILEVPISYHGRGHQQGKKITPIDSLFILSTLLKYRLRN